MKRCSTLTIVRETETRTTVGNNLTSMEMSIIKTTTKKKRLLARNWSPCVLLENVKWYREGGGKGGSTP